MSTTWILVANASSANLYANEGPKKGLKIIKNFEHTSSRERSSELSSDKLGHGGHGTFVAAATPKQNEARQFSKRLARELEKGRTTNAFQRLILVAPPQFMGLINTNTGPELKNLVSDHFEKDYTKVNERTLSGHLESCIYL